MKKFLQQYKIRLTIFGFLFVFLPVSFFVWKHLRLLIEDDIARKQHLQVEQEIKNDGIRNIPELTQQAQFINDNKHKINLLLEDSLSAKIALYAQIEDIATTLGHKDVNVLPETYQAPSVPQAKKNKKASAKVTFAQPAAEAFLYLNIHTLSTYNEMIAFLEKIDNMQYLSDVIALDIVAHTEGAQGISRNDQQEAIGENLVDTHYYVAFYLDAKKKTDDHSSDEEASGKNQDTEEK